MVRVRGGIATEGTHIGVEVSLSETGRPDALLFGEGQSRILLSLREADLGRLEAIALRHGVPVTILGRTGGSRFLCTGRTFTINLPVAALDQAWRGSPPTLLRPAWGGRGE